MADTKQGRGRPRKPGKSAFNFRMSEDLRRMLEASAEKSGLSLTEEAERRLRRDYGWEAAKGDIEEMKLDAAKWRDSAWLNALRFVGFQILRETDGRPTRLVVDLQSLLSEADGIARGMRSGFVDPKAPPLDAASRPMTSEEAERVLAQIEEIRREIDAAKERMAAEDAAGRGQNVA